MADMKNDYYQEVTNEIIKAIEEGTTPWQQGWKGTGRNIPKSSKITFWHPNSVRNIRPPRQRQRSDKRYRQ